MCKSLAILLAITFCGTVPGHSQNQLISKNRKASPASYDQLMPVIDSLLKEYKIPGAAIAIVNKDSILYLGGIGWADVPSKTPVDENTLFRIGSITKSFVALGILKLVEEGKIDLQSPLKEIVPEIDIDNPWENTNSVKIVHLLEHTAGFNDSHFNDYYLEGDPEIPLLKALLVSKHCLDVRWKPGEWYSYSSVGYLLAGCIIEKVTGMKFEDYLRQSLMKPMGLTHSVFHLSGENQEFLAQGYKFDYQPSPYWYSYSRPAGSLHSSAGEMAKFLQFMLRRGRIGDRQILSETSINRMETSRTHPATRLNMESGPRLGIGYSNHKGFGWFSHYGSIMGFAAAYTYSPDLGLGCALLTNRWDIDFETGMMKVWNSLRDFLVKDVIVDPDFPPEATVSSEILHSYTGYYKFINPPQKLGAWIDLILNYEKIKFEQDTLYQSGFLFGEWERLLPVTSRTFREEQEVIARKAFFRKSDGELAFIDRNSAYYKCSPILPWVHVLSFLTAWLLMFSSIIYALIWIPVELYKRILQKESRSKYLHLRVIPLVAVCILLVSFTLVGMQVSGSLTSLGQRNFINIFFYLSTLIFAVLSFVSIYFVVRSLKSKGMIISKIYALLLSLSCIGMTIYWWYWDIIGLRLWSY